MHKPVDVKMPQGTSQKKVSIPDRKSAPLTWTTAKELYGNQMRQYSERAFTG